MVGSGAVGLRDAIAVCLVLASCETQPTFRHNIVILMVASASIAAEGGKSIGAHTRVVPQQLPEAPRDNLEKGWDSVKARFARE